MKKLQLQSLDLKTASQLLNSIICPRPIAFVSTINKNGIPNAAPFDSFMGVTPSPLSIAMSIQRRGDKKKDTLKNIEEQRDFVINLVDETIVNAMNTAAGSYPPDMSEFDVAGLTTLNSEMVKSPRIAESPVHLECKLRAIIELGDLPASLVIGEVLCIHAHEEFIKDNILDYKKLKLIAHAGESTYLRFQDYFELNSPT